MTKDALNEYHRKWEAANPDKVATYRQRFKDKYPNYSRDIGRKLRNELKELRAFKAKAEKVGK